MHNIHTGHVKTQGQPVFLCMYKYYNLIVTLGADVGTPGMNRPLLYKLLVSQSGRIVRSAEDILKEE